MLLAGDQVLPTITPHVSGMIEGGWEYVIAAYVVTGVVLLGYTLSVVTRWRAANRRAEREARRETHG